MKNSFTYGFMKAAMEAGYSEADAIYLYKRALMDENTVTPAAPLPHHQRIHPTSNLTPASTRQVKDLYPNRTQPDENTRWMEELFTQHAQPPAANPIADPFGSLEELASMSFPASPSAAQPPASTRQVKDLYPNRTQPDENTRWMEELFTQHAQPPAANPIADPFGSLEELASMSFPASPSAAQPPAANPIADPFGSLEELASPSAAQPDENTSSIMDWLTSQGHNAMGLAKEHPYLASGAGGALGAGLLAYLMSRNNKDDDDKN